MKTGRMFWGIFFLTVGIMFLVDRYVVVPFDLTGAWRFWPLVLILAGCSLLLGKPWIRVVLAAFAAVLLGLLVFGILSHASPFGPHHGRGWRDYTLLTSSCITRPNS